MSSVSDLRKDQPVKWLTVTAMLMALNIAMSSFGVPVPGGHLYLNDAVICTAAILLDPLGAFLWAVWARSWATFSSIPRPCSSLW